MSGEEKPPFPSSLSAPSPADERAWHDDVPDAVQVALDVQDVLPRVQGLAARGPDAQREPQGPRGQAHEGKRGRSRKEVEMYRYSFCDLWGIRAEQ